uniref:tRNA_int_end_N2 domain-containing protein n=1 Tax=Syphacia muris TaxID=451379 RepID=A0A0N5AEX7_9BILA
MDRQKSKRNLLLLELIPGNSMLEVIQKRTSRLETMGVVCGKKHLFFPEEAVWLMEAGQAAITFRGNTFSIQHGDATFHLLASSEVSFTKYLVYSYLKRAGYIVLRSNRASQGCTNMKKLSNSNEQQSTAHCEPKQFPQELLDQFPSISTNKPTAMSLYKQEKFANCFCVSSDFPVRRICDYSLTFRFKERLRPYHWPRLDKISASAIGWSDYREAVEKAFSRKRCNDDATSCLLQPDYDIYANNGTYSHTYPPSPLFQLLVWENSFFGVPSQSDIRNLSSQGCVAKLLIAVVQNSVVLFYDTNHHSIQL